MGQIGKAVPRTEDDRFTRGAGEYTADLSFPGEAWLHVVRSPFAHADVVSTDWTRALEMPGVVGVLTPADLEEFNVGTFSNRIRYNAPDGRPMFETPRSLLAQGRVRYAGEPVLAIVAETRAAAQDAAECVDIEYVEHPVVPDLESAIAPQAPEIWPEAPANVAFEHHLGDRAAADAAFSRAAHVTKLDLRISRVSANPLEPRVAIAVPDRRQSRTTIYVSTQTPHSLRTELAENILRVPASTLRVVALDVGGGFGMKSNDFSEYGLCVLAAKKFRRPIKWIADRSESFLSDNHARDNIWTIELALDRDHRFLAVRTDSLANLGAYLAYAGTHQATNNVGGVAGLYATPHMHARIRGIYTNTQPVSPYRGAGRPEATFAIERVIEVAARELGIDAVELRRRNLIQPADMPFRTGLVFTYDCGNFPALLDRAIDAGDWNGFAQRRADSERRGRLRGRGLGLAIEIAGGPPGAPFEEYASLTIDQSGSAFVKLGTHSHGQGHETAFAQILSDFMQVPLDGIHIAYGDTDVVPHGRGTFGSRSIAAAGAALNSCCVELLCKARVIAGHILECDAADIVVEDGRFVAAGSDRRVDFKKVVALAYSPAKLPPGVSAGLSASHTLSTLGPTFPNSAHVCEVEVDPDTGTVKVDRYLVVDDVGTIINPLLLHGQIHGGVAQGLGQVFFESIVYDQGGQLLTGSFQDYGMPRADNLPSMEIRSLGVPTKMNPLGAKGAGEAGAVGSLASIVNAICNALERYDVRHMDPPVTPEKIWRAICRKQCVE